MEKSIFFFRRKPDRTPANFAHHYITNHAPLGKRLTRCLRGYTVNIVDTDGFPAAVTEHWVPAVMDILTPSIAYASDEDFMTVVEDDQTLFSGFDLYVVTQERVVLPGDIDAPLEQRTPGVKLISTHADADNPPPPPAGAWRVVDNLVSHKLVMTDSHAWEVADAGFQILRMAWYATAQDVGADAAGALKTAEYRFIAAPSWDAA